MSEKRDDLIGKQLGQYVILEEVGRGGMASVYRATQQSMNRIVAIKILPRHFLHDPGFMERFEREVEVISHLEHPHILPIYDYGQQDGIPYIAMRYLGGGSMAQMIRRGVPPLEDLERPFNQIAQALDYAHRQGIIHRDLKPGNIMLDEGGNAYLSDFGIARVMGSDLTGSAIIGTPAYMSPEQANGLAIDARSDIYSLGVVLFELITGREPYQAETPMALLLKHLNEPLPPIRDFRDNVPQEVEEVVQKATEKDPDNRYSSASEMAAAFSAALRGEKASTKVSAPTRTVSDNKATLRADAPPVVGDQETMLREVDKIVTAKLAQAAQTANLQPSKPNRSALLIGGLVTFIALVVAGLAFLPNALAPAQPTPSPADLVPTPFRRGEVIATAQYSITIPEDWVPPTEYIDRSDPTRLVHIWEADDGEAFATLSIPENAEMSVEEYDERYYQPQEQLVFIDEATAPDGTLRRSYRLEGDARFPNGQMDVFYIQRDGRLIVIELYLADSIGADLTRIDTLQLILNSFRYRGASG